MRSRLAPLALLSLTLALPVCDEGSASISGADASSAHAGGVDADDGSARPALREIRQRAERLRSALAANAQSLLVGGDLLSGELGAEVPVAAPGIAAPPPNRSREELATHPPGISIPSPSDAGSPLGERTTAPAVGVAASRTGDQVVAFHTDAFVFVSRDGGRTFASALFGRSAVSAIAVGDDGAVFVARGKMLGVQSPTGAVRWRALPDKGADRLHAGGGSVFAVAANRMAVSADQGLSWTAATDAVGAGGHRLFVEPRGALHLITTDSSATGASRWRGPAEGPMAAYSQLLALDGDGVPAPGGWFFGRGECSGASDSTICAQRGTEVVGLGLDESPEGFELSGVDAAASNLAATALVRGGWVVLSHGQQARLVSAAAPEVWADTQIALDAADGLWIVHDGRLLRLTPDRRWWLVRP